MENYPTPYFLYRVVNSIRRNHRNGHTIIDCTARVPGETAWCGGEHAYWLDYLAEYNRLVAVRVPE